MIYASKPGCFGDDGADVVSVDLPLAYIRAVLCCVTVSDFIWLDEYGAATQLSDEETAVIELATSNLTTVANE